MNPLDSHEVGRRLQEWRRIGRNTQDEVAKRLGTSRSNVAAIEAGQRRLTAEQIVNLAKAYGLGVNNLVRQGPPPAKLSAQFRLPADATVEDRSALDSAVASLEQLVERYLQLETLVGSPLRPLPPPPYEVRGGRAEEDGEEIADAERRRLGLGDGTVEELRDVLEREIGLRTFSLNVPGGVAGLFGVSPTAGPAVAINAGHPSTRQRWTLCHEYAHFLVHRARPEVTRLGSYQRVPETERFAEAFAAAFLMPRSGLVRRLRTLSEDGKDVRIADLLVLAGEFGVSAQAMILRLEGLRFVSSGEWDRLQATRIDLPAADRLVSVRKRQRDMQRFPRRYILLALEAYRRELITERELAEFLDLDRLALRRFLSDIAQTTIEGESIEWARLNLSDVVEVNAR